MPCLASARVTPLPFDHVVFCPPANEKIDLARPQGISTMKKAFHVGASDAIHWATQPMLTDPSPSDIDAPARDWVLDCGSGHR
mmetsp:Transcript_110155/g.218830  ORF Transcript_110155/g.218830 Transcript_110155/m.218830 type:complete len:83 (-) Transcript_110155:1231-1479(-)